MKKRVIFAVAMILTAALALASCAAPAPVDEAPPAAEAPAAATHAAPAAEAPADAAADAPAGFALPEAPAEGKAKPAPAAVEAPAEVVASEAAGGEDSYGNYEEYPSSGIQPGPGVLTAGEWRDHDNWEFFTDVLHTQEWQGYQDRWALYPENRVMVTVGNDGKPVRDALVTLYGRKNEVLWKGMTDNKGKAYLFYNMFGRNGEQPHAVTVEKDGMSADRRVDAQQQSANNKLYVDLAVGNAPKALDLMLVVDTTGSMGDELTYLTSELENVVTQVQHDNGNIPVRTSVNFYKDEGDEYVVRSFPFTGDVAEAAAALRDQYADGGGDYEEAVEQALDDAIFAHDWQDGSTKLLFLVLDAPPHNTRDISDSLKRSLVAAAKQGIRVIPVASSGVDKETEYLMRTFAAVTGGTYTFLTDDSGVGEEHMEPTIGDYEVQYLNDMLVGVIGSYLKDVPVAQ